MLAQKIGDSLDVWGSSGMGALVLLVHMLYKQNTVDY